MKGDALAAGAKFATFGPAKVSQERWDEIFGDDTKIRKDGLRICALHPAYRGVYPPRVGCRGCGRIYKEKHDANR